MYSPIKWYLGCLISFIASLFVGLEAISMLWFSSACLWARLTSLHFHYLGLSNSWKERLVKSCCILISFGLFCTIFNVWDVWNFYICSWCNRITRLLSLLGLLPMIFVSMKFQHWKLLLWGLPRQQGQGLRKLVGSVWHLTSLLWGLLWVRTRYGSFVWIFYNVPI